MTRHIYSLLTDSLPHPMIRYLWPLPWTCLGLAVGTSALVSGGGVRRGEGVIEFHGGLIARQLRRVPIQGGAAALTMGHVVLGRSPDDLTRCRRHELVHVRQYERWGPVFIPAYLGWSAYMWFIGRDPYRDNPFELEAYQTAESAG
jgi:hypothetical protein